MANYSFSPDSVSSAVSANKAGVDPYNYGSSNFGDWLGGTYGAAEQASRQSQLDYSSWLRSEISAKRQRDFELMMSNTQVQRTMADLKAAGLNPWLAVQSAGFGGSVPTGASASSASGQASSGSSNNTLAGIGSAAAGIAALFKTVAKLVK